MVEHVLVIDTREPAKVRKKIRSIVEKVKGWTVLVETLPVGDYKIDNEIIIERKSFGDFVGSTRDGRLFTQASDMDAYDASYVAVVGNYSETRYHEHLQSFTVAQWIGARCSILAKTKVKVIEVDNITQFASFILVITEKHSNLDKTFLVERHSKTINRVNPNLALYLSVPGIGMATANKLIDKYPKFMDFFGAYQDGSLSISIQTKSKKFLESIR